METGRDPGEGYLHKGRGVGYRVCQTESPVRSSGLKRIQDRKRAVDLTL